jgi:hypothetical protein
VEKILLALLVTIIGSFVLPSMLLARVFVSRRVKRTQGGKPISFQKQIDHVPVAPAVGTGKWKFHPLTAEEKKQFSIFRESHLRSLASNRDRPLRSPNEQRHC